METTEGLRVELERCTGCGACILICPHGAIVPVNGGVGIKEEGCALCVACIEACPENAIIPWVQGEIVPGRKEEMISHRRPPTLARAAGTAIAAASAGLLLRAVDVLAQVLTQRLARPTSRSAPSKVGGMVERKQGRQRRYRHRRRG